MGPALVEPRAKRAKKETDEESLGQQRAAPCKPAPDQEAVETIWLLDALPKPVAVSLLDMSDFTSAAGEESVKFGHPRFTQHCQIAAPVPVADGGSTHGSPSAEAASCTAAAKRIHFKRPVRARPGAVTRP